ncbi:6076_t:CDS:2, partial [Entrophospora sp. SA101]
DNISNSFKVQFLPPPIIKALITTSNKERPHKLRGNDSQDRQEFK